MVSNGWNGISVSKTTEIFNPENNNVICQDIWDYPLEVFATVGSNMGSFSVICGGVDKTTTALKQCYKLMAGGWHEFATMTSKRGYAASIVYDNSLIIFGGHEYYNGPGLQSTEIINGDGQVSLGPNMPIGLFSHAIAVLNSSTSFISGGETSGVNACSSLTWYYYHVTQTFQSGPSMMVCRGAHASGAIMDHETNEKIVVVAGGYYGGTLDSTELLINGEWQQGMIRQKTIDCIFCAKLNLSFSTGPQMPKKIYHSSVAEFGKDLYTIGGYSPDGGYQAAIHKLSCSSLVCTWTTIDQQLQVAKAYSVAIVVEDSFCKPIIPGNSFMLFGGF